ncbi:MAG: hypothetical protein EAZ43_07950 [Betaproteobacteria bacterium]|nr:MAG: hypothetical protein EAZ43_07950 [Betaproteobacteria bacterium]
MNWSNAAALKAQLMRQWERGELLRDAVTGEPRFPLRLSMRSPSSTDITERFEAVRAWAAELAANQWIRVEWQAVRHRVQGSQNLPASVWVDTATDALHWLGKTREYQRFVQQVEATRATQPALLAWLKKRPLQALELGSVWSALLGVVAWIAARPRPGIYVRQIDVPGVHSKFIEAHRGVLTEMLDLVLPAEAVDISATGVAQFHVRYGFLEKPARIRLRVLDPSVQIVRGAAQPDVSLDGESFASLRPAVEHVFITENETNFLAFPPLRNAIVIFGAGYGWDALARAQWLADTNIHYWGDIDTHGFGILDQLRGHLASVKSLLMDRQTLVAHTALWGTEAKPLRANLPQLTPEERSLYEDLRDDRIGSSLRLEQEHIGFQWASRHIQAIIDAS